MFDNTVSLTMQIQVKKEELQTKLKEFMSKTEDQYRKQIKAYSEKLNEYAVYVGKYVAKGDYSKPLKAQPYLVSWNRDTLTEVIQALEVDQGNTIIMTEREYTELVNRAQREYVATTASLNAIEELCYIG